MGDWGKKYDKGQGGVGERESRRWEVGEIGGRRRKEKRRWGKKGEMGMGQLSSSMSNQCLANTRSFKKVRKLLKVPIVHQLTTRTLECSILPLPCGQRCLCKLRTAIQTRVKITCLCCS